ncbi:MAG: ABC transporter permease, partial [Dehalococcoidales bacterium]|nr:ABC transporter permease [Dehalococcoidales bacterium]
MLKIIKHLKPFVWSIVAIFLLLFGSAMADLSLPGYMANIVNIGIEYNGIENAVPEAISSTKLAELEFFMDDNAKTDIYNSYKKLDRYSLSTKDYAAYLEKYPILNTDSVYELATSDGDTIEKLNEDFSNPIIIVTALNKDGVNLLAGMGITVPEGSNPFDVITQLTPEQMAGMQAVISQYMSAIPKTAMTQVYVAYLTAEYQAIGVDLVGIQTSYIMRVGGIMLLITLAGAIASVAVGFLASRVASGLGRNLRKQIFTRVEDFSNTEFDKFSTASLITRSTNDITQIQMLAVMLLRIVIYAPIMGIGGLLKVIGGEASMAWIIAAAVLAMMIMMGVVLIVAVPKFKIVQKLVDKVNLAMREILTGMMVIRAFNTQKHEEGKFDVANQDLTKVNLFINRIIVVLMPLMTLVMNVVMITIVWAGAYQV